MAIAEEVYHAYEHDMMELYSQTLTESQKSLWCFKDVESWIKNDESYVIGGNPLKRRQRNTRLIHGFRTCKI